jgi:hypothetical protein
MTSALVSLWQEEMPTIRDVVRLFTDVEYRYRVLEGVEDIGAQEFWEYFEELTPSTQWNLSLPVIHRMQHFYRFPTLYAMMCHPDTLDFTSLVTNQKIILISLGVDDRKVPPPEQQLLGAVLVSQLQMAVMASLKRKTPFYLYIDEVQNFVTSSLNEMLGEARKYDLNLTVANQFLGQLKGKTLEAVMGNVGITVVFQVGPNDARALASFLAPEFKAEDLMNLNLYQTAVKMRLGLQTLPAFSLETRPRPGDSESQEARTREERIRQRSIKQYTPTTREEVLAWHKKRYPRTKFAKLRKNKADLGSEDWVVAKD